MRFGLGVPTATEGLMYPVPYAGVEDAVELAVTAERLGFDSVWGNDHVSTQAYVRDEFPEPPRFLDPWLYLAYVAARTTTLRLATCVTVLPFRHPVVLAKQIATLDRLSGGRLTVGVGIGAYREEFEAMWPGRKLNRGEYAREALESLRLLFTERRASYDGTYVTFDDVESHPKPVQEPLPILSGGNAPGSRRRAATLASGWLPACLTPKDVAAGKAEITEIAGGGLPAGFEVALQVGVCLGRTREDALERFRRSQLHSHLRSLSGSTLKGRDHVDLTESNLIGTVDDVLERVEEYRQAGVTTLAGLLFAENDVPATIDAMTQFSEEIIRRADR